MADLQYAAELGYTVKLLAVTKLTEGQLEIHVQPTLIRHGRPLATVDGAFNMIALEGDAVGRIWYSGPGAGQMPTASAVVADVVDMAVGRAALTFSRRKICSNVFLTEDVPAPDEPVTEMIGYLVDITFSVSLSST